MQKLFVLRAPPQGDNLLCVLYPKVMITSSVELQSPLDSPPPILAQTLRFQSHFGLSAFNLILDSPLDYSPPPISTQVLSASNLNLDSPPSMSAWTLRLQSAPEISLKISHWEQYSTCPPVITRNALAWTQISDGGVVFGNPNQVRKCVQCQG